MSEMSDMRDFPIKKKYTRREVEELLKELDTAREKIDRIERAKRVLMDKLEAIGELNGSTPEDCERGPWCDACEFNRTFVYREYRPGGHNVRVVGSACGKGKSCPNFVQRSVEE